MGIRKVNLNDLQGSLTQRGRERYENDELKNALIELLETGESFIWEDAIVEGNDEKSITASKMKWRNRAVSVFKSITTDEKLTIRWTNENEMFVMLNQ